MARTSGVWRSVTSSVRRSPPVSVQVLWTSDRGAVSSPTHGPPNGHPVPVAMSTPNFKRAASRSVCSSIAIHCGDRYGMKRCFRAANAVDWRDLDAADSGRRERLQLRAERRSIDRAALPPPPRPRPGLGGNRRPSAHLVLLCRRARQAHEGWRNHEQKQAPASRMRTRPAEFKDVIDVNDSQARCCLRRVRAGLCSSSPVR